MSVIARLSPGARASGSVPETIAPEVRNVKPGPLAETKLRPAGSVSATVMPEAMTPLPTLTTTSV